MVLQMAFGSPLLSYLFHITDSNLAADIIRYWFTLYPPFNFAQLYQNIARKTAQYPDFVRKMFVQ